MDNEVGSGDSEPSMIAFEKTWQQLKHQMEYEEETLRRVPNDWPLEKRTAYWMYLSADNEGWEAGKIACMSGSPRKVGEDGALREALGELLGKFERHATYRLISQDETELTGNFRWLPTEKLFIEDVRYQEMLALLSLSSPIEPPRPPRTVHPELPHSGKGG